MEIQLNSSEVKRHACGYGRSRRWLGITYVGAIVLASLTILLSGTVTKVFGSQDSSSTTWFVNVFVFVAAYEVLALPFDVAGFAIERLHGRTDQKLHDYLISLVKAVTKHALLLTASAFAVTASVRSAGIPGLLIGSLALSVLLIWKQTELARLLSDISFHEPPQEILAAFPQNRTGVVPLVTARNSQHGFTGGVVGLPGAESIVIPEKWLSALSPLELWAEVTRRNAIVRSGGRTRGVGLAVGFTLSGILLSALTTQEFFFLSVGSSAGLVTMSLCFTLWSFVGLLTLPYPSRSGTYEADKLAADRGVSRDLLSQTLSKIDKDLEEEPTRTAIVEAVFHPVPTVINRLRRLDGSSAEITGAWHSARYAIVLSVIGLGLLGRAVHCNAGKPELWGMLPAD
ncbi:hypothetical protein BH10CYA1_BH10CYA1_46130 [soil metagenome]